MKNTNGYGMGPDYRIHTYERIHEPAYRPYNSYHEYDRIHTYDHAHNYEKIREYNHIRTYDNVYECKYYEYEPNIYKPEKRQKPVRQWTTVPVEMVYYKDVWSEPFLCYKMPMGPDIRVNDYVYNEYTPSSYKLRYLSYEDIKTDHTAYMDRPWKEYHGNVDYKLTPNNYHPFKIYSHKQRRTRTVMKRQYHNQTKDKNDNKRENVKSENVAAVTVNPKNPPPDKWRTVSPHNTPSPDITPVEVAAVIIASPGPDVTEQTTMTPEPLKETIPVFVPVAAVAPIINEKPEIEEAPEDVNREPSHPLVAGAAFIADTNDFEQTKSEQHLPEKQEEPQTTPGNNTQTPNNNIAPAVVIGGVTGQMTSDNTQTPDNNVAPAVVTSGVTGAAIMANNDTSGEENTDTKEADHSAATDVQQEADQLPENNPKPLPVVIGAAAISSDVPKAEEAPIQTNTSKAADQLPENKPDQPPVVVGAAVINAPQAEEAPIQRDVPQEADQHLENNPEPPPVVGTAVINSDVPKTEEARKLEPIIEEQSVQEAQPETVPILVSSVPETQSYNPTKTATKDTWQLPSQYNASGSIKRTLAMMN